jgi:cytochrome c biogenesis protein CcmG/thiol:disulfide interchange protein DsbE
VSESRKIAPKVALVAAILAVAFIVVLVIASPESQTDADSPLLGNPAPAVVTTTIENETFDLARRKGSWVVLNFFNSTCVPCRAEHPELLAFADAQAKSAQPAELYTVINDDSDGAVKAYFDEHGGSWPKLRDDNGTIAVAFGVARVPETWIVDPNGFVRLRIAGKLTEGLLDEQLAMLQGQS